MAVELGVGYISLVPSAKGFGRKLSSEISNETRGIGAQISRTMADAGLTASASFGESFAKHATDIGKKMTLGLTLPLAFLGKSAFDASRDLNESLSKSNTIFGTNGSAIDKWASGAAKAFGQSRQQALENASSFGNMFRQLDIGLKPATNMSKKMVELASDFASFHNPAGGVTEVLLAQQAAFRGEYDAVQRFVPTINAATVQTRALADSGKTNAAQLTAEEKATATYELILAGAGKAAGDFGRTSGSVANQQRSLHAQIQNTMADVGSVLIPIVQQAIGVIGGLASGFQSLPPEIQTGIVAAGIFVAALGPVLTVAGNIAKVAPIAAKGFGAIANAAIFAAGNLSAVAAAGATVATIAAPIAVAVAAGYALHRVFGSDLAGLVKGSAEAGQKFGSSLVANVSQIGDTSTRLNELRESLRSVKGEHIGSFAEAVKHSAAVKLLQGEIGKTEASLRAETRASAETQRSLGVYGSALAHGGDIAGTFVELTQDGVTALDLFRNAQLAAAGGEIGRQQALLNIQKAQQDYNDTVAEFGPDSTEAHAAQLALNQAQLQGVQATDSLDAAKKTLIKSILDGTVSYDGEIARLQQLQREHPENAAGYQLEIDKLNDAKTAIDRLPAFVATTYKVDVQGIAEVQALVDAFHAIPGNAGITVDPFVPILPHALGGIFTRPHVGLFAEAGAEAVLPLSDPQRSWELIAQSGLLDSVSVPAAAAAGGGGMHFNGPVSFGDRDVIPALDYFTRTRWGSLLMAGGASWIEAVEEYLADPALGEAFTECRQAFDVFEECHQALIAQHILPLEQTISEAGASPKLAWQALVKMYREFADTIEQHFGL